MREKTLTLLKLFFGWPITLLALFFILKLIYQKTNTFSISFTEINFFLLFVGIICFLGYFFLRALLWHKILLSKNHTVTYKEAASLWALSEIRRFIPGNIWSFASRIFLFSSKKIDKKTIAFGILQEAQSTVLGSAIVSIFSLSFVFSNLIPDYLVFPALLLTYSIIGILCGFSQFALLCISAGAFFFFGLGTYFTIFSVVTLSPYYFLTFISLFSFSYLIGYLSLITPMGLGVREGVLTFGLARFIAIPLAGFAALYTRVVLILTELLFFFFVKTWQHTKNPSTQHFEKFLKIYWREVFLAIAIIVYVTYFSIASFARHDNFYSGRFDLGNMSQTVWNTSQGKFFQLTDPNGTEIISRLAFHADFFLVFLSPLYKVWPDPKLLLFAQTIIVGFGAFFVFLLAKKISQTKTTALIFAVLYLLNPAVQYANLYDFHSVTLVTTFLFGAFFFLLQKQYVWFTIFSLLAASTKENIWIVIAFFGVYIFQRGKTLPKKMFGLLTCLFCAFIFYYLVWIAIPDARGGNHFALSYYSDFGDTPTSILKNALFSPHKIIGTLLQNDRLTYIYQLFLPLGFVSFLSPLFLIFALPDFFIILMSNNSQLRQIYYHYASAITPFLFVAAIYGIKRINAYYYLLLTAFYSAYAFGPLPGAKNPNVAMFTNPYNNKVEVQDFLKKIDQSKSVSATNNLGAHLTHREKLYTIPIGMNEADVVVLLLNDISAQPSLAAQIEMAKNLKKDNGYRLVIEKEDFVMFQKK